MFNNNKNNERLHGSWHLLVEMRVRMREINSTVIREQFILFDHPMLLTIYSWKYLMSSVLTRSRMMFPSFSGQHSR